MKIHSPVLSVSLFAAVLFLSGCVIAPMDVTTSGRTSILPASLKIPVRTTVKLATAEDPLKQMGSTFVVGSGKIYRQVFVGDETSRASLDLLNSSLTQSSSDFMLFATNTTVTYAASVLLQIGDQKKILTTTATANTAWTIDRAAREAIERAVIDLAKQCEVYLAEAKS